MAVGQNPENRESRDLKPFLGILKCANLEFSGIHIMKSRDSAQKVSATGNLWISLECISRESAITAVYSQFTNNSRILWILNIF